MKNSPQHHRTGIDGGGEVIKIACIGKCMVELAGTAENENLVNLGFAGDTMNAAVYLSRLLDPNRFEVAYLTRLGQDSFSDRAIGFLQNEGVQAGYIPFFTSEDAIRRSQIGRRLAGSI